MGVYGILCLCHKSFLMIMISFVILFIQVSFPANTPVHVYQIFDSFFCSLPIFLVIT